MESLVTAAGLITVAVITPGPNNLIVLREAASGGWRRVLPAGVGVVAGGLAILAAVLAGAGSLARADAGLLRGFSIVTCVVLALLGAILMKGSGQPREAAPMAPLSRRLGLLGGMFLFQFLNPKSWLLVVAVVSSIGPASGELAATLPYLVGMFLVIPTASLALWSVAGRLAVQRLSRPDVRAWFDRATGALLIGFAVLLLLGAP